jgi:hypothetical protein
METETKKEDTTNDLIDQKIVELTDKVKTSPFTCQPNKSDDIIFKTLGICMCIIALLDLISPGAKKKNSKLRISDTSFCTTVTHVLNFISLIPRCTSLVLWIYTIKTAFKRPSMDVRDLIRNKIYYVRYMILDISVFALDICFILFL